MLQSLPLPSYAHHSAASVDKTSPHDDDHKNDTRMINIVVNSGDAMYTESENETLDPIFAEQGLLLNAALSEIGMGN